MRVKRLPGCEDLPLPARATEGAAGFDLYSAADVHLFVGELTSVPTGIAVEIPLHCVGLLLGRSGLAFKHGVTVGHVGTIDSDFRGEVKVLLEAKTAGLYVRRGVRIGQLLILPLGVSGPLVEAHDLTETVRGTAGFGSTGT